MGHKRRGGVGWGGVGARVMMTSETPLLLRTDGQSPSPGTRGFRGAGPGGDFVGFRLIKEPGPPPLCLLSGPGSEESINQTHQGGGSEGVCGGMWWAGGRREERRRGAKIMRREGLKGSQSFGFTQFGFTGLI